MDENSKNLEAQPETINNFLQNFDEINLPAIQSETVEQPKEVIFRHPQQVLTNKEIQILLEKKSKADQENYEREQRGEEPIDGITEVEKGAIQLFFLRAKHQNSRPKLLSSKERSAKKAKRRISKQSRKVNR